MGIEFSLYKENHKTGEIVEFIDSGKAYPTIQAIVEIKKKSLIAPNYNNIEKRMLEAFSEACGYVELTKEEYLDVIQFMVSNITEEKMWNGYFYRIKSDLMDLIRVLPKIDLSKNNYSIVARATP